MGSKPDRILIERLKDFIKQRKNVVLKQVPPTISLKTIMERLKLDFRQIKKLYDFKLKAIKTDEKYMKLAKSIIIHELNSLSAQLRALDVSVSLAIKCILGLRFCYAGA